MKKNLKQKLAIGYILLISILIINPLLTQSNPHLSQKAILFQPKVLRMGVSAQIISGNWDVPNTDGYNILEFYKKSCLEPLLWYPDNSVEPKSHLATSWEFDYRPDGYTNSLGFNNSGGVKAITITLRNGVTFSDGSNWNATVAKWNIDRIFLITGNLTGNANGIMDQRNAGQYWFDISSVSSFFTADWNLSEYDAPDTSLNPITPPDPSRYSYYYLTDPDGPSPVIAKNPNPYGGWDPIVSNFIHYAPYDMFPLVKWVDIIEDLPSGGKIRIELNCWNFLGLEDSLWVPQISMHTYKAYNETAIYGYQNGDDMIGTGPYIFQEHNVISMSGYMLKNQNYWNRTALEAAGWFDADQVALFQFPPGEIGKDAQNIALLTHQIDYAFDSMPMEIDYAAVIANPNINYIEYGVTDYIPQITLNSINETWWTGEPSAYFNWVPGNMSLYYPHEQGGSNGIPRAVRKALSYAFDYDTFINTDLNNRLVRVGSMLGVDSYYYNSSILVPFYNLTFARQVLLNTESDSYSLTDPVWPELADNHNFSKQLANRGLTDPTDNSFNNALWQTVASTNPIFEIEFFWDDFHQDLKDQFELAANNLGVALVDKHGGSNRAPPGTDLWSHCVGSYWINTFDGYHSIWSAQAWVMDYAMPASNPLKWVEANYGDPNNGTWRAPTYTATELWPGWNFGFSYDTEVDYWLDRAEYSDSIERDYWFSKIAEKEQNELYPMIYAYQRKEGRVLWNNWEMNFNRGDLFFANFRTNLAPTSNHPSDIETTQGTSIRLPWILRDEFSTGNYRILINGSPSSWFAWENNTQIDFLIDTTQLGIFNYTIQYYDSSGKFGIEDTIIITVVEEDGGEQPAISGYNFFFILISIVGMVYIAKKVKSLQQ
ncbi:MAG: ABC transporter substrate-binding protein [Candidatus Thorarchaeota archaeon]